MKIFLPFKISATGGTSTFARNFKQGMEAKGHRVSFDFFPDYDILFVIIQCHPRYLIHAKLHRKKIIHRLDGVYYWSVAKWKYPLLNLPPKLIHKFFSDFTVYQSNYSKYCVEKFLGRRKDKNNTLIYNGVDTNLFSPAGETIAGLRDNPGQKIFITVSKFRRKDQILPIIRALEIYQRKFTDNFKLLIIGDFSREVAKLPDQFKKSKSLVFLGKIPNQDLPKYERAADVFLFTHLNPPCPNNIIEAMACGLPICGVADGAMPELTKPGFNSLLIPAPGDAFWQKRTYNYDMFAANLNMIIKKQSYFSARSRQISHLRFEIKTMLKKYIYIFDKLR
jgi:glycosyltransferase involved in cell wall biosynthesis